MALAMLLDSIEDLDESQKTLYKEVNGKYQLDLEGYEDPAGLKSALEKERLSAKESNKLVKELQLKYKDIDPEKVKTLLSRIENDAEAKLLAEGKLDEVVQGRTEKLRVELEKRVSEADLKADAANQRTSKFEQRVLDNNIRAAASTAGLHAHAIEDALIRARTIFRLDDNGDPVQLDADGQVVFGKDGKSPFNPGEWLEEMKDKAPHWFPVGNSGGGAGGGTGEKSGKKEIPREQFDAMSQNERAKFIESGGKPVDT